MFKHLIDLCSVLSELKSVKGRVVVVVVDDDLFNVLKEEGEFLADKFGVEHLVVTRELPEGFSKSFKVDYDGLEQVFGGLTPVIVAKVATLSFESIKQSLDEDGLLGLVVNGERVAIPKEFFVEEVRVVDGFELKRFSGGFVISELSKDDNGS